jgi:hypothetical protein
MGDTIINTYLPFFLPQTTGKKMTLRAERRTPLRVENSQQAFTAATSNDATARAAARPPRAQAAPSDTFTPRAAMGSSVAHSAGGTHLLLNGSPQQSMDALVAQICRSNFSWRFKGIAVTRQLSGIINPMLQSNSQSAWTNLITPMLPLANDSQHTVHHKAWICNLFGSVLILKASLSELGASNGHRQVPAVAFQSALQANEKLAAALHGGLHMSTALNLRLNRVQLVSWLSRY